MLLSLDDFTTSAYELYKSKQSLRGKDSANDLVLHKMNPIYVPETMTDRVQVVYSGIISNKMAVAVRIATEDDYLVNVAAPGASVKSERDAERAQAFLQGFFRYLDQLPTLAGFRHLVAHDTFFKARGWARVQPKWSAWRKLPGSEFALSDYFQSAKTLDDIMERANAAMDDLATLKERQDAFRREYNPIHVQWCDADSVFARTDSETGELSEVYEYQRIPVQTVRAMFRDEQGGSRAKLLEKQLSGRNLSALTDQDQCTVVIRADHEHMQVAIMDLVLDEPSADGTTDRRQLWGTTEEIWRGEHGMGMVPYAYFPGRTRPGGADDRYRYHGLCDDAIENVVQLDTFLTQRASVARQAAWSGPAIERHVDQDTEFGGDRGSTFRADEGVINNNLNPGDTLVRIPWVDADSMRTLDQHEAYLRQQIDLHTFGPIVNGTQAASSGYEFAQANANAEGTLVPFLQGLATGYARLCRLILRAGRAITRQIGQAIPIRYVGEDGAEWVELTAQLAEIEWDVEVKVRTQPVGGLHAMAMTYAHLVDRGIMTDVEMAEKLGIRFPQRVIEARRQERLANSQTIWTAVEQAIAARITAGLGGGQPQLPAPPGMPQLPSAGGNAMLAPIMARLPQSPYGAGDASMGGAGALAGAGLPNMGAMDMAPAAPSPPTGPPGGMGQMPGLPGAGGNPEGQGLAVPTGSYERADYLNSLR